MVGLALGYTLTRAATGFEGKVNRAYNTGSTRFMKTMMFVFFISAVLYLMLIQKVMAYESILMGVTGSNWCESGPYGIWFGKFLMLFGFSAESLAAYTG